MESNKKEGHKGKLQIQNSRANIEFSIRTTYEEINIIKIKNERHEKERRLQDEARREQRYYEIQNESLTSSKKNAALEGRWNQLKELEECEELFKEIDEQKKAFTKIRSAKDKLINEFKEELKKSNDDYTKMLKNQSEDIRTMIGSMRKQFYKMRDVYLEELQRLEREFSTERDELLLLQKEEIEKLFNDHTDLEKKFVEERDQGEEEFIKKIEKLRIDGAKNYATMKITLETDIQNLEKCFEDMKALYQLNAEKLDYNLKVLKEKNDENSHLSDELKRKDQTLNNRLRKLTSDYHTADKNFKNDNKNLTAEYKRITKQFKELQRKFKHFEKADLDRFTEIQKMNEAEVRSLKQKILKCDNTVHQQQLGMEWFPPEEESNNNANNKKKNEVPTDSANQSRDSFGNLKEDLRLDAALEFDEENVKILFEILIDETEYLLDDKIREQMKDMPEEEKILIKMETIKKCLGIDSVEEMNMLMQKIDVKRKGKKLKGLLLEEEGQEKLEEDPLDNQENPFADFPELDEEDQIYQVKNEITEILITFMNDRDQRKRALELSSTKKAIKKETQRELKERLARDGKHHWERLTQVLSEETFRVWKVLDVALSKYYELLLQRQSLINETGDLHNQNEELKNLLHQYLQINHELIIPPTRLIRLEQN